MTDGLAPYLVPSLVVGLGEWGAGVALAMQAALQERSPALARACQVAAFAGDDPLVKESLRAQLRASRAAEMVRALQQDGLMQLDPVVSPATHVYLVADSSALDLLRRAADLVEQWAVEIKAKVNRVALVDVADLPLPAWKEPFPLYVLEPVTSHGLVLDPAEYRDAAVEALLAATQPGGCQLLAGGRGVGTLGIAWLAWSPAAARGGLVRRLGREALLRCLSDAAAVVLKGAAVCSDREVALLDGLPFHAGLDGTVEPSGELWGPLSGRRLRRAAAVLDRRIERWQRRVGIAAQRRAAAERQQLETAMADAVAAGGFSRLRALLEATGREAGQRLDAAPPAPRGGLAAYRTGALLRRLEAAEGLPGPKQAAIALGAGIAIFTLIWWATHGGAASWLAGALFQAAACGGYLAWRPWRIRRVAADLADALTQRATAAVSLAHRDALVGLDQTIEVRCTAELKALERLPAELRAEAPSAVDMPAACGALSFPLLEGEESFYRELQAQLPDLAARLGECLRQWREPGALLAAAEAEAARWLAEKAPPDPAVLATRAYGSRLAERLHTLVGGLLDWSQPLLARPIRLPEGQRWLLWPQGLPCPPVPPEVTVLPYARSCVAGLTIIRNLPEGDRGKGGRTSEEKPA